MTLLASEVAQLKVEVGLSILTLGAEPYVGISQLVELVIVPNLQVGASTTSSTSVALAEEPTLVTLTLASGTGFSAGDMVVVDVDQAEERATVRSVSGNDVTLFLQKEHAGTYPVSVWSGEAQVRWFLARIRETKEKLASEFGVGALKRADDIEWYNPGQKTGFGILGDNLDYWRRELGMALNLGDLRQQRRGSSTLLTVY